MAISTDLPEIRGNIETYEISAAVSTLDPTNLKGSTGSVSFTTAPFSNPFFIRNRQFTLTDSQMGSVVGRISEINYDKSGVSITAETSLQRLNATITFPSIKDSFQGCMNQVLALANFSCTGLSTSGTTVFPGWTGTFLDYLKHFCIVYDLEYYVSSSAPTVIVFRPIRSLSINGTFSGISYSLNDQTLAKNVQVDWFEYDLDNIFSNQEFTPAYVSQEPQILTVDPGATAEYDIQVNAWPSTLQQPTALDYVGPAERTSSAYCVAGSDGLPIMASQWTAQGGSVTVSVSANDPTIIHVVIRAPMAQSLPGTDGTDRYGPYSIAATAVDDNAFYNSLHIVGNGVRFKPRTLLCPTGAVSSVTLEEVGAVVSNPFVNSLTAAYKVGVKAAQIYAGPTHTMSADLVPKTADLANSLGAVYSSPNGNTFRMENVSARVDGLNVDGVADTLLSQNDLLWQSRTLGDYDTLWTGKTLTDQAASPLWNGGSYV